MGAGAARSVPVHLSPPMPSLSRVIWGAGGAVALLSPCQGSHQSVNLVSQLCSALYRICGHGCPSPYLVTGFLIFAPCLASSNHQLGIGGPGTAIEISYWTSNMLVDSMEEMIFEMPLHLSICYLPGQCNVIWLKVPSSLMAKEWTFSWLPWITLYKFCIKMSNDATVSKITVSFCRIWAMLAVGPCTGPYLLLPLLAILLCFPRPPILDSGLLCSVPHGTIAQNTLLSSPAWFHHWKCLLHGVPSHNLVASIFMRCPMYSSGWGCRGSRWLCSGFPPSLSQKGDLLVIHIRVPVSHWISPRTNGGSLGAHLIPSELPPDGGPPWVGLAGHPQGI